MFLAGLTLLSVSCSSDDPDPDNGEQIKPGTEVADPTGTVLLSMRNDDDTSLNGIYIGSDDNFHGSDWVFSSLGTVRGLGNVSSIPTSGWAPKVAVIPNYGYVAYNRYTDEYIRIFVTDYLTAAGSGGVIGANVKYQKPFRGLDEKIMPDADKVVLAAEGGRQQVIFKNSSIIPFKVTSSEGWCHVEKASTRSESFLYDAIVISSEESFSGNRQTATVTIETLFGQKSTVEVTREGRGAFITATKSTVKFGFNEMSSQTTGIECYSNIDAGDITITTSDKWLTATLSQGRHVPERSIRWIAGRPATRAMLDNPVSHELLITAAPYAGSANRTGTVTLSYGGATTQTISVTQDGSQFKLGETTLNFMAGSQQHKTVYFSGNIDYSRLSIDMDESASKWISADVRGYSISITVQPNPFEQKRSATLKLMYADATGSEKIELSQISITQDGSKIEDAKIYFESKASNYTLLFPVHDGAKITSSTDWCTASVSGSNLIIRATASTENRTATISVSGISAKIYVSQSKYKVGDTYSEKSVEGQIVNMEGGVGRLIKAIDGTYAWSNENVENQGARSETDGLTNTKAIMSIPGWENLYPAFAAVNSLNTGGVTGWYLPARLEAVGDADKWSSTEQNQMYAFRLSRYYGSTNKSYKYGVTAMHQFSYDFFKK